MKKSLSFLAAGSAARSAAVSAAVALLCACGARPGLGEVEDGSVSPDAVAPPSCWTEPNCIEGTIRTANGDVPYAGTGEPAVTQLHGIHLNGPAISGLTLAVQIMPDARAGTVPLSRALDLTLWVNVRTSEHSCTLIGEAHLDLVDVTPGGVTEGRFEGTADDCPDPFVVTSGRFRLTHP